MNNRSTFSTLRLVSVFSIVFGVALFTFQLARFSRVWANLPYGLTIAGVPVGGLDRQQAAQRVLEAYSVPVELHYGQSIIQLNPTTVGFELDTDSMLAAAELERVRIPFWNDFWSFLWGQTGTNTDIPLKVNLSTPRLRAFLQTDVAARYDHAPTSAMPIPGTINFQSGSTGTALDVDRAVLLVDTALRSTSNRVVDLPLQRTNPARPAFQNLEILLKQTIELAHFDGTLGFYLVDLQNGQEINFNYKDGQPFNTPGDIAFTASSTIKIPIMISVFRRLTDEPSDLTIQRLEEMIGKSINQSSDWLMQNVLDKVRGPLIVTEDMQSLGLKNTFLAGYFYDGAPLLQRFNTPANTRTDVNTDPDPYSQTTASELGASLKDIYQCSTSGGGTLVAVYPGEITQAKCTTMIDYLVSDRMAQLIQAGVPDGTKVAHKHGWVSDINGVMHNVSDAAIVFTPGGNYVMVVYIYHPNQLVFDPTNKLVADLSKAAYNYYNLP